MSRGHHVHKYPSGLIISSLRFCSTVCFDEQRRFSMVRWSKYEYTRLALAVRSTRVHGHQKWWLTPRQSYRALTEAPKLATSLQPPNYARVIYQPCPADEFRPIFFFRTIKTTETLKRGNGIQMKVLHRTRRYTDVPGCISLR